MAQFAVEVFQEIHGEETPIPAEMKAAVEQDEAAFQAAIDACGPLVSEIVGVNEPTPLLKELDATGSFHVDYLAEHHGVTPEHVEALYECAKFRYESGEYAVAADYLNYYRLLVGPAADAGSRQAQERSLQALWGRFAANILVCLWDDASKDLQLLIGAVRQSQQSDLQVVQQRAWLLHWALFIFANHPQGRTAMIDLFMAEGGRPGQDKITNLNVIVLACPWLLRYLVAVLLMEKRKQCVRARERAWHAHARAPRAAVAPALTPDSPARSRARIPAPPVQLPPQDDPAHADARRRGGAAGPDH